MASHAVAPDKRLMKTEPAHFTLFIFVTGKAQFFLALGKKLKLLRDMRLMAQ
jgi:hypothetical protein